MFSIETSQKNKVEIYKGFLIDHWGVLIFIPAILGGLLQLLKLANMNISYVRFFAVEQVVPDGLLIIFLSTIGFIIYKILNQEKFELKNIKLGWNKKNLFWYGFINLITILFFCFLLYLVSLAGSSVLFIVFKIVLKFVILLCMGKFYLTIRYLYYFKDINNVADISKVDKNNFIKKSFFIRTDIGVSIMTIFLMIIITYFLMGILEIYKEINRIKDLKNETIFLSKVGKELNVKGDISIEYFNGKYIFLKINTKNSEHQFLVLKGEGFVNLLDEK